MPSRMPAGGYVGEGFGIVYLEANAHGCPVVAGAVGGALDAVVDGVTGLLVDPEDHIALSDALVELLEDPARRRADGRGGRSPSRGIRLAEDGAAGGRADRRGGDDRAPAPRRIAVRALYVNHTSRISGGELSLLTLLSALPAVDRARGRLPRGAARRAAARHGHRGGADPRDRRQPPPPPDEDPRGPPPDGARRAPGPPGGRPSAGRRRPRQLDPGGPDRHRAPGPRSGPPTIVHVRDCLPGGAVSALTLRAIGHADAIDRQLRVHPCHARRRAAARPSSSTTPSTSPASTVSTPRPAAARAALGLGDGRPVLAVIAQITPWKGQDDAIRIARALAESHPEPAAAPRRLGEVRQRRDPPRQRRLPRVAASAKRRRSGLAEAVRFMGERDDVPELLRAVDVLLAPSWEEPFGRAIVEAMAAGVPVVATAVGGPPEILGADESGGGITLPPHRPDAWADAIGELLEDRRTAREDGGGRAARRPGAVRRRPPRRGGRSPSTTRCARLRAYLVPKPFLKGLLGEGAGVLHYPPAVEAVEIDLPRGWRPAPRRRRARRGPR